MRVYPLTLRMRYEGKHAACTVFVASGFCCCGLSVRSLYENVELC